MQSKIIPLKLRGWMTHSGSFMERLKEHQVKPQIRVLSQQWAYPTSEERAWLKLPMRTYCLIREVMIYSEDKQWMYARTIFPQQTLTGAEKQLGYLKNRSLGSVLFKNPTLIRSPFHFLQLNLEQYILNKDITAWARRSLFFLKKKSLLLTEVFLPDLYEL